MEGLSGVEPDSTFDFNFSSAQSEPTDPQLPICVPARFEGVLAGLPPAALAFPPLPRQLFYQNITSTSCLVCGAKAVTWYFGAASCKPCHRFFRRISQRVIAKGETGNQRIDSFLRCCLTGGKCRTEGEKERSRCTVCRYRRCIQVGMRYRRTESSSSGNSDELSSQSPEPAVMTNQTRPSVIRWAPKRRRESDSSTSTEVEQPSPPPSSPSTSTASSPERPSI